MVCLKKISQSTSFIILSFLLAFILFPVSWCEARDPVSVDAGIDNAKPTLGDILTYSVTVTHDPDIVPHTPEYVIPEGLEKIQQGKMESIQAKQQTEFWLKLRVDKIGPITFPAIPVEFDAPDQNKQMVRGKIMTPEVIVEVQSLLQLEGNASDIKDIKPIADIKAPWAHYFWKALGVLCLLALAYFLWKSWKKKSVSKAEPTIILTAEQRAMQELQELQKREWMKLGRIQDHFFELSEIFRRYLENRYRFPAQEWTTEEIIKYLKNFSELNDSQKLEAKTILTESDKVKFAKAEAHNDPIEPVIRFIKKATPSTPVPATSNEP